MMNWAKITEQLRLVRAENEKSIAFRRADVEIAAQDMRVEYAGSRAFRLQSDAARQASQAVFILGEPDMDVELEDRFTYGGILFRVVFVQPNRLAATIAEAIAVE